MVFTLVICKCLLVHIQKQAALHYYASPPVLLWHSAPPCTGIDAMVSKLMGSQALCGQVHCTVLGHALQGAAMCVQEFARFALL